MKLPNLNKPLKIKQLLFYCWIFFSILFINHGILGQSITTNKYLVTFTHKDIGEANMVLEIIINGSTFEAFTRQNADLDILGNVKAKLARKMTNFKKGSLIRIDKGEVKTINDSLKLSGVFVSSIGNYYFNGSIVNNTLVANLTTKNQSLAGTIKGSVFSNKLPLENYSEIIDKALILSKEKFFNITKTQTDSWKTFDENMREVSSKVQDDLEMIFTFYYFSDKLKTSHFALLKSTSEVNYAKEKQMVFEEKSPLTAYLKVKSFDGSKTEVDSVFKIILDKNYSNLIIDLRGNSGGNVEAGMAMANYLFDSTFYGGVFLTQKWFKFNAMPPAIVDYPKFPFFSESNFDKIISGIHESEGLCLKIIPNKTTFIGKIYVLTDKKTASTCEPLVYALKNKNKATIIGQTTAGAMLNGEKFNVGRGFSLFVPTADYYTSDGYRIDQNGVKPNLETKPESSLDFALKSIKVSNY